MDSRLYTVTAGIVHAFGHPVPLLATVTACPAGACRSVGLLDAHVHDVVLAVFPRLDVGLFGDDEGAEVAAVEHHDVGGALFGVEVHERRHQNAERQTEVVRQLRCRGHALVVAGARNRLTCLRYVNILTLSLWAGGCSMRGPGGSGEIL